MRKIAVNIKLFFFRKIIIIQRHWIYLRLFSIFSIIIFYEAHQKDFYCLLCLSSQCLKIIQKVSSVNIASKASFVYLLIFWIFAPKNKTIILAILALKTYCMRETSNETFLAIFTRRAKPLQNTKMGKN